MHFTGSDRRLFLTLISMILLISSAIVAQVDTNNRIILGKDQDPAKNDEQLATQYFRNREYDKAIVLFEKLFEKKKSLYLYTYLLYSYVEIEDYRNAEKLVKKQIRQNPARIRYEVDLGYVFTQAGELNKAKKQFDKAISMISPNKGKIIELANAFLVRGQTNYAIKTYQEGRKIYPVYPFGLELAGIYHQIGDYGAMVDEYLDLLEIDLSQMKTIQGRLLPSLNDDPENEKNELLRRGLLRRIQRSPDKIHYSELLLWLSLQQKDFEMAFSQAKSLDRRLSEAGERIIDLAGLCISNEKYDVAIDAYKYVMKKGKNSPFYLDSKVGLLNVRYLKITSSYDYEESELYQLEKEYISVIEEYGKNVYTVPVIRYLSHLQAFYLNKVKQAISILNEAIEIYDIPPLVKSECKIELADILLFSGDIWEATLLYSQVEKAFKNEPMGHLAKFKNARLSFYIGEFKWAKAQLDVLKAATSKLISNDAMDLSLIISDNIDLDSSLVALGFYARADLLLFRNHDSLALVTLDSVFDLALTHPIFDEVIYKKALIKLENGNFEKAKELYEKIVSDYAYDILADDALFALAELYHNQFNNPVKAGELYKQLLMTYPGSLFTVEARKRFRELRGDFKEEKEVDPETKFFHDLQP